MNATLRTRLLPAALGMLCFCAPAPVSAAQYTFTNIADNSTIASFGTLFSFGLPAVSGNTVAFQAYSLKGGRLQRGILTGSGGPLTTIAANTDDALFGKGTLFYDPAISGNSAAFVEYGEDSRHGGSGIFVGSGGPLTTIVKSFDAAPSGVFYGFDDISISGNRVAFVGRSSGYRKHLYRERRTTDDNRHRWRRRPNRHVYGSARSCDQRKHRRVYRLLR